MKPCVVYAKRSVVFPTAPSPCERKRRDTRWNERQDRRRKEKGKEMDILKNKEVYYNVEQSNVRMKSMIIEGKKWDE